LELGAERLVVAGVPPTPLALVVELEVAGLAAGLGLDEVMGPAGFLAVVADADEIPLFSAVVSVLTGL